jgi:anti-sigma-K factor RskA
MTHPDLTECKPHDEAEELLPWYANGQLDATDRERVDAHLSSCAHCRRQLELERRLIHGLESIVPEVESGWARLRNRIEAREVLWMRKPAKPGPFAQAWDFLTRPAVATVVAAQVAFVVVAGAALVSLGQPAYHTLGSAAPPPAGNVIVMFRADATELDIRNVLRSAGASLVDGPTPANAYLLHVSPARRQLALRKLQSDDNVQLAQPIDGGGS